MSVARVTTINFKTKEAADNTVQSYSENAPTEFPEAEQLLQIRVDDTTVMVVSLYENNEAMERLQLQEADEWTQIKTNLLL